MNNGLLLSLPGGGEWIIILLPLIVIFFLPLFALVDILRSDFRKSSDKIVWLLVVIFIPILGWILYFSIGRKQKEIV